MNIITVQSTIHYQQHTITSLSYLASSTTTIHPRLISLFFYNTTQYATHPILSFFNAYKNNPAVVITTNVTTARLPLFNIAEYAADLLYSLTASRNSTADRRVHSGVSVSLVPHSSGTDEQQSKKTPSNSEGILPAVGQHAPVKPSAAHLSFRSQVGSIKPLQQYKNCASIVGQHCPVKFNAAQAGFNSHKSLVTTGGNATGTDCVVGTGATVNGAKDVNSTGTGDALGGTTLVMDGTVVGSSDSSTTSNNGSDGAVDGAPVTTTLMEVGTDDGAPVS